MSAEGSQVPPQEPQEPQEPRLQSVFLEVTGRVAELVIDRPPLNILDLATLDELGASLVELSARQDLQMVIVRGGGMRAFCAGVSIEDHTPDKIGAMLGGFHDALRRLFALDCLTVAAVDGHCLGGGMELAATCDLVIATERSTFGQPEIELGCFPPVAAALYPRLLGDGVALDLLATGRKMSCEEAERRGFVTRRLVDETLEQGLRRLKSEITSKSTAALRLTKKAVRAGSARPELFESALAETERLYIEELATCEDLAEGVAAFLEKRPPEWRHA